MLQEGRDFRGDRVGFRLAAFVIRCPFARVGLLGDGHEYEVRGMRRVRAAPGHALHGRLEILARVCEHVTEDDVERLHQWVVGAERLAEREDVAGRFDLAAKPRKVPHVAATEPVDRLFPIADEETLGAGRGGVPAMRQEAE